MQEPVAVQKQVALTAALPEAALLVNADGELLRRVVHNLVGNALKFTPAGGAVRVAVTAAEGEVRLAVSDTGPGITLDLQARLFQKFVTGRVPGHGSGLGLVFCRLVVEAHGGRVGLESAPGHGATFYVSLPAG
jgi:signal transduction histidine kinase